MNFLDSIITYHLIIRPFEVKDWAGFRSFMLDQEATRFLLFPEEMKTESGAKKLFNATIQSYASDAPVHAYSIALQESDIFIGSCGFSAIDEESGIYECYYSLLPDYWKKGYATEAMQEFLKQCFMHFEIDEMRAYMSPDNPNSAGVAERLGMQYQGIRNHPLAMVEGNLYSIRRTKYRNK